MSTLYCTSGAHWLSYSNPCRSRLCRLFRAAALAIPVRIWTRVTAATLLGLAGAGLVAAAGAPIPEDVLFERDLEFSKPDGQSLQLNIARPRTAVGTLPPTLCIHGTQDDYVGYEQAVWITERLKAAAVEARLLTLEGAGHGFKGDDAAKADREMLSFFDSHLKRPVPSAN